jgi:hypothetical protein
MNDSKKVDRHQIQCPWTKNTVHGSLSSLFFVTDLQITISLGHHNLVGGVLFFIMQLPRVTTVFISLNKLKSLFPILLLSLLAKFLNLGLPLMNTSHNLMKKLVICLLRSKKLHCIPTR